MEDKERGSVAQAKELGRLLLNIGKSVSTAESCTGGNIAHKITSVPGSSSYYKGSVVAYANEVKSGVLGVSMETIMKHGAVSREVVEQMAEGVRRLMGTDLAVATSGVAGPGGGTAEKPVGTVWIAAINGIEVQSECFHFGGTRAEIIEKSTEMAIFMLKSIADK